MGVFPALLSLADVTPSLPHARGGVSVVFVQSLIDVRSSPRPWGCFHLLMGGVQLRVVFPTPVGVFLLLRRLLRLIWSLPHARGGVSTARSETRISSQSSPRPWGCFRVLHASRRGCAVFPTPVGVFPRQFSAPSRKKSLPHARGGVSASPTPPPRLPWSSPRPWGCFPPMPLARSMRRVFPTPVGVFHKGVGVYHC